MNHQPAMKPAPSASVMTISVKRQACEQEGSLRLPLPAAASAIRSFRLLSHFANEERELVGPLARHGFFPGQV